MHQQGKINREDMLELTRRMTLSRNCFSRIAGAYFDKDGYIDGTFNRHFRNLTAAEQKSNLEIARLQLSFDTAAADGYRKFILFLHYPPTSVIEKKSAFTQMAERYHAEHVVYSHCHGEIRFHDSIRGEYHGINYHLVSSDFLKFRPERIL